VDTQNEVIKEEKRARIDNAPYGKIMYRTGINKHVFKKHPYGNSVIGSMEDLNAAQLEEFIEFHKKFYGPNNAVLVVAGDFDSAKTKQMIQDYFGPIPRGNPVPKVNIIEDDITEAIKVTEYDSNIQIPVKLFIYRTPTAKHKDTYALNMVSSILTTGKSSRMYKNLVESRKALQVLAFNDSQEDYGTYIMGALPMGDVSLDELGKLMDKEIERLQTELISEKEFQKLQNIFENNFVNSNSGVSNIANTLARNYMLRGNTNLINEQLDQYRSVTREDLMRVANTYLKSNQRIDMDYIKKENEQ
jgi:predicted Zn-dependent peptidase